MSHRIQVVTSEYDTWASKQFIQYASCSVPTKRQGFTQRLLFGVYLNGPFEVTRGDETLYSGPDFAAAQMAFNDAA